MCMNKSETTERIYIVIFIGRKKEDPPKFELADKPFNPELCLWSVMYNV